MLCLNSEICVYFLGFKGWCWIFLEVISVKRVFCAEIFWFLCIGGSTELGDGKRFPDVEYENF